MKAENEKEIGRELELEDSLVISRMDALLDFYSDRATDHASFFVASFFGMVSISAIILQLNAEMYILRQFKAANSISRKICFFQ